MNKIIQIPKLFNGNSEMAILKIDKENEQYIFSVSEETDPKITELTLKYFKEIIGIERLKDSCHKPCIDIDLKKIDENTLTLTKSVVRKIFVGLLDVQQSDLEGKNTGIDEVFQELIPFESIEHIEQLFMGYSPNIQSFQVDKAGSSGKGFKGLIERIYVRLHHHFMVLSETDAKAAELRDIEMLTSRLADREMQKGEIVHLKDGYFYVDQLFIGGGAYLSVLKDVEEKRSPKIICRGTAMRRTATSGFQSGINDILLEIGTMGVKSIWPELSRYLKENQIKSIEILGKSLGGAHAQELAILIEAIEGIEIKKLTTFCSVGVGESINNVFKNEILKARSKPLEIQIIRNGGSHENLVDYIPAIGGVHLGEGSSSEQCNIEVCYIQPGNEEVGIFPNQFKLFDLVKKFLTSFSEAHCRQSTLNKFRWKKIDKDQINEHLRTGILLEKIRKCFAYVVHIFTLFLLNAGSFASYLYAKREESKAESL